MFASEVVRDKQRSAWNVFFLLFYAANACTEARCVKASIDLLHTELIDYNRMPYRPYINI